MRLQFTVSGLVAMVAIGRYLEQGGTIRNKKEAVKIIREYVENFGIRLARPHHRDLGLQMHVEADLVLLKYFYDYKYPYPDAG